MSTETPTATPTPTPATPTTVAKVSVLSRRTFDLDQVVTSTTLKQLGDIFRLYPQNYDPPKSLLEACAEAKIKKHEFVVEVCLTIAAQAKPFPGTLDDQGAGAIALYSFDFGEPSPEDNPYFRLNRTLFQRNTLELRRWRGYIYMLLKALRSLPPFIPPGKALFRGITKKVQVDDTHYHPGNTITWHTLCSTSLEMQVTKQFLTDKESGVCKGTLFVIRGKVWGYDISPYSCIPSEREILLEPETNFIVTGVLDTTDLIVVDLDMQESPLLLQELLPPLATATSTPTNSATAPPPTPAANPPPTAAANPASPSPRQTPTLTATPTPTPTPVSTTAPGQDPAASTHHKHKHRSQASPTTPPALAETPVVPVAPQSPTLPTQSEPGSPATDSAQKHKHRSSKLNASVTAAVAVSTLTSSVSQPVTTPTQPIPPTVPGAIVTLPPPDINEPFGKTQIALMEWDKGDQVQCFNLLHDAMSGMKFIYKPAYIAYYYLCLYGIAPLFQGIPLTDKAFNDIIGRNDPKSVSEGDLLVSAYQTNPDYAMEVRPTCSYFAALWLFHIKKDVATSAALMQRLSIANHLGGMYSWGLWLETGLCGAKDMNTARHLYNLADGRGHIGATTRLAQIMIAEAQKMGGIKSAAATEAAGMIRKAADMGLPQAQIPFAMCNLTGAGGLSDVQAALKILTAGANALQPDSLVVLGKCHFFGTGVDKDIGKAAGFWEKAANIGNTEAMYHIAHCHIQGLGVEQSVLKAANWLLKASSAGSQAATIALADLYRNGGDDMAPNEKQAAALYKQAHKSGNGKGTVALLRGYMYGECGMKTSRSRARKMLKKAIDSSVPEVMVFKSQLCRDGSQADIAPLDTHDAEQLLQKATDNGSPEAAKELAFWLLEGGDGLAADPDRAALLFASAAAMGDDIAQLFVDLTTDKKESMYELGLRYEQGLGVPLSLEQARTVYEMAATPTTANPAHAFAAWQLGRMWQVGLGGLADQPTAQKYFSIAAASGVHDNESIEGHIQALSSYRPSWFSP
ncbi:sel1 repeat family protein [Pelomyxa schiedti]|nr:sel1 repeat family protein [Pelomyxa schiedti]